MCDAASSKRVSVLHSKPDSQRPHLCSPGQHTRKKGGPDNGLKKWGALALHTRPGDRKRTPFSKMPLHFFRFCVRARPEVSKLFRSRCRPRPLQQPLPRLRQILTVSSGS